MTYYADCDRSLLVLAYDHLLTDVHGMQTAVNRWMELTGAICSGSAIAERNAITADRLALFARPADSGSSGWPPTEVPARGAAAAAEEESTAAAVSSGPDSGSRSVAEACRQWLATHHPTFVSRLMLFFVPPPCFQSIQCADIIRQQWP